MKQLEEFGKYKEYTDIASLFFAYNELKGKEGFYIDKFFEKRKFDLKSKSIDNLITEKINIWLKIKNKYNIVNIEYLKEYNK